MNDDKASKLSRLGRALEAYLEWRATGAREPERAFLARHEEIRDLLEPMLREQDTDAPSGTDPTEDPLIGEQLGDYRIVASLGRGAMGFVYEAQQVSLGRRVALKVLPAAATMNPQAVARFYRESALVARLHHEGIVEVLGVGQQQGRHFYAMELVRGTSLAVVLDALRREGLGRLDGTSLPRAARTLAAGDRSGAEPRDRSTSSAGERGNCHVGSALRLVIRVAEALHHAHEAGVLHRDVKPSNILIRDDGSPVLTDFGLAREAGLPSMTLTGEFAGTPYYVSPEQALGRAGELDRRTDIFSLGITLYEVLTLRRPFEGDSSHEVLQRILTREPSDPRRFHRGISPDLSAIVLRCLEKDPGRRYATAEDLAADLRSCLELRPVSARRASTWERVVRWTRREPLKAAVLVLVALGVPLIAGLGGYVLAKQEEIVRGEEWLLDRAVDDLLQQAFVLMESDEEDRALELFDEVLEIDARKPIAVAGKVLLLCGRRAYAEALALFDRLPEDVRADRAVRRARAYALSRSGRGEEAAALHAELGPPQGAVECLVAAMERIEEGHLGGGASCFQRARDHLLVAALESPRAMLLLHQQLAHALGHLEDAEHGPIVAQALERNWPDSPPAWFWSSFAVRAFDRAWAERALRRAVDLAPESHFYAYNLGTALLQWQRPEEALPFMERAARLRAGDARTFNNLGACYLALDRHEEALRAVRHAAESNPEDPLHRLNVGNALVVMGRIEEACSEYRRVVDQRPDYVQGWYEYARTLYRHRRLEEFAKVVEEARLAVAEDPRITSLVGRLALLRRDAQGARAAFASVVEADPEDAEAHLWLSRALRRCGESDAALQHAERAVALQPGYGSLMELAGLQEEKGDLEGALRTSAAAEAERPDLAAPVCSQARLLEKLGCDPEEVEKHLRRALEKDPDHHPSLVALGRSRFRAGDYGAARPVLVRAVQLAPRDRLSHDLLVDTLARMDDGEALERERQRYRAAVEGGR